MTIKMAIGAGLALGATAMTVLAGRAHADKEGHGHVPGPPAHHRQEPVRITMEELHRHGGVPPGWRFTLPSGEPKEGREVFVKLECFKCHEVKGDQFPSVARQSTDVGPDLTGMGRHHPSEYFAESVLNPNAVIVTGPGYTGPDALSIMPDYQESLTASELVDLVAYLKGLTSGDGPDHHATAVGEREQLAGDYRVRMAYQEHAPTGTHEAGRHGAGKAAPHGHPGKPPHGHLMVFVTDAKSGDPVPYLPVTATIHAGKKEPRSVKLAPMVGGKGFHYGADLALPANTTRVLVRIGPTTMHVMPSAAERFKSPVSVSFDWSH
jgi:Cytochrome c/Fe2+ transport protein